MGPIWELIESDPELSRFADAVRAANLQGLFDGTPPEAVVLDRLLSEVTVPPTIVDLVVAEGITAFVPTNAAIDAVPNWEQIVADSQLAERFVLAHVVAGQLDLETILTDPAIAEGGLTALGGDVLEVDQAAQTINAVQIVTPDLTGTNGTLHIVNGALVVPEPTPPTTETPPPVTPLATQPPATTGG